MRSRGPVVGILAGLLLSFALLLGLVGCLQLGVIGLLAVAFGSALVAVVVVGAQGAEDGTDVQRALLAAAWTAIASCLIAGVDAVAGGVVAAVSAGVAAVVVAVAWVLRTHAGRRRLRPGPPGTSEVRPDSAAPLRDLGVPVALVPTSQLGREWLRTTAALAGRLDATTRQLIVRRRSDALDELERRDPDGFARWLAEGFAGASDPADYVHPGHPDSC